MGSILLFWGIKKHIPINFEYVVLCEIGKYVSLIIFKHSLKHAIKEVQIILSSLPGFYLHYQKYYFIVLKITW